MFRQMQEKFFFLKENSHKFNITLYFRVLRVHNQSYMGLLRWKE